MRGREKGCREKGMEKGNRVKKCECKTFLLHTSFFYADTYVLDM